MTQNVSVIRGGSLEFCTTPTTLRPMSITLSETLMGLHNCYVFLVKMVLQLWLKMAGCVFIEVRGHWADWLAVRLTRLILTTWFEHVVERSSDKEVQFKILIVCLWKSGAFLLKMLMKPLFMYILLSLSLSLYEHFSAWVQFMLRQTPNFVWLLTKAELCEQHWYILPHSKWCQALLMAFS